jgi:hypothetical protein
MLKRHVVVIAFYHRERNQHWHSESQIRTWFAKGRSNVAALFSVTESSMGNLRTIDLNYWRTIEERLLYALKEYPWVQIQVSTYILPS